MRELSAIRAARLSPGFVFLDADGTRVPDPRVTHMLRRYIIEADIGKPAAVHIWRHSMATHMLEGGADVRIIQQILGHAELSTTEIYTRVSIKHAKAVHEATHPAAHLRAPKTTASEDPPGGVTGGPDGGSGAGGRGRGGRLTGTHRGSWGAATRAIRGYTVEVTAEAERLLEAEDDESSRRPELPPLEAARDLVAGLAGHHHQCATLVEQGQGVLLGGASGGSRSKTSGSRARNARCCRRAKAALARGKVAQTNALNRSCHERSRVGTVPSRSIFAS